MTSITNPLPRNSPRPLMSLKSVRTSALLKASVLNAQPILPNYPLRSILQSRPGKRRVRFELKLDPVQEEGSSIVNHEGSEIVPAKPTSRIDTPWRDNRLRHNAYTKTLEKQDISTDVVPGMKRLTYPSASSNSNAGYPHTYAEYNRSSPAVVDLYARPKPLFHSPIIVHRLPTRLQKNTDTERRQSSTLFDFAVRQRLYLGTPPRSGRLRKPPSSFGDPTFLGPIAKRIDLTLPVAREVNHSERPIRINSAAGRSTTKEHFQTKRTP